MTHLRVGFGAVTLDTAGGGIAAASRLIWQVVHDRWGDDCQLVTLIERAGEPADLHPSTLARIRFGATLAGAQAFGRMSAVLYSHLSLAKVQYWLPAAFRRPYAVFLHGIEVWRPLSAAERQVLSGAALLVANSGYTARRVREVHPWVGPIAECALALPEAVGAASSATEQVEHRNEPPTVIIVARMSAHERYKGHDQILDAWPVVRSRIPDARLVIVGDGDDAPRLRAKAASLGLAASVLFTGFVTEAQLAALYQKASVFAMPSREEGFGLVYLEAMARGVPCIGSIHDAAGGVITDGVTGYLVDQADVRALADRITNLLSDPSLRLAMGREGQRRVEQHFTYARFRDRLLSLLETAFEATNRMPIPTPSQHVDAPPRS
jgi:phosphatidylinositol alpha-1,6-mannosyltransferase